MTIAAPSPPARPASEIPVAPSIPLLGSLPWMAVDAAGFLERVAIEKGPIARIPFGAAGMVMLTHPDDARYVLHEAARKYLRGEKSRETVQPVFGNGPAISDPPFWLRQRRIMQPSFSRARIATMTAAMNAVAERHLARLTDGQELNAHDLMLGITRDVIVETMFSQQLPSDIATLDSALAEIDRYIKIRMLLPFRVPLSWPLPFNVRIREATAAFDRVVYGIIDRREQGGERPGDLLDALLDARDEETGERMSRKELRDEVLHIFFAGHETTANALTRAGAARAAGEARRAAAERSATARHDRARAVGPGAGALRGAERRGRTLTGSPRLHAHGRWRSRTVTAPHPGSGA
ncbi:cytochrome P450 [Sorangium sp. So ce448]|uniref:cytochrome P450 n=1 Tax=Sorangium sp. So ce448 TaxID=3133314 RepID=UPI003F5D58F8